MEHSRTSDLSEAVDCFLVTTCILVPPNKGTSFLAAKAVNMPYGSCHTYELPLMLHYTYRICMCT